MQSIMKKVFYILPVFAVSAIKLERSEEFGEQAIGAAVQTAGALEGTVNAVLDIEYNADEVEISGDILVAAAHRASERLFGSDSGSSGTDSGSGSDSSESSESSEESSESSSPDSDDSDNSTSSSTSGSSGGDTLPDNTSSQTKNSDNSTSDKDSSDDSDSSSDSEVIVFYSQEDRYKREGGSGTLQFTHEHHNDMNEQGAETTFLNVTEGGVEAELKLIEYLLVKDEDQALIEMVAEQSGAEGGSYLNFTDSSRGGKSSSDTSKTVLNIESASLSEATETETSEELNTGLLIAESTAVEFDDALVAGAFERIGDTLDEIGI